MQLILLERWCSRTREQSSTNKYSLILAVQTFVSFTHKSSCSSKHLQTKGSYWTNSCYFHWENLNFSHQYFLALIIIFQNMLYNNFGKFKYLITVIFWANTGVQESSGIPFQMRIKRSCLEIRKSSVWKDNKGNKTNEYA